MGDQMIFKRYEIKYLLNQDQYQAIRKAMEDHMIADEHGESTIYSLYCDTPDFLLARRSMEKPVYKEKMRIRSYGPAGKDTKVFLELKKKYKGVVYKRRLGMTEDEVMDFIHKGDLPQDSQIMKEMCHARSMYPGLKPAVLLTYDRQAFYDQNDHDFRMTFDRNVLWRDTDVDLHSGAFGSPILKKGQVLLEVKTAAAIPMWLVKVMSENKIYKTSFSKYGNAYKAIYMRDQWIDDMLAQEHPTMTDLGNPVYTGRPIHFPQGMVASHGIAQ